MKNIFYLIVVLSVILTTCTANEPPKNRTNINLENKYPHLVQIESFEDVKTVSSTIYIDSVEAINVKSEIALLISGNFSNSCTSIQQINYTVNEATLSITLIPVKPADKLCATVLTPFSYLFDQLSTDKIKQIKTVVINDTTFNLGGFKS